MNLQHIKDVVPHITDRQILGVATALARQPAEDRVLFARMLGLDGAVVIAGIQKKRERDRNRKHRSRYAD